MQGQEQRQQGNPEQQQGEDPKSNREMAGDPTPKKTDGTLPKEGEKGTAQQALQGRESWGNLPIHVRDIFRADGSADMPGRYRRWIDSYYKKLNQESSR